MPRADSPSARSTLSVVFSSGTDSPSVSLKRVDQLSHILEQAAKRKKPIGNDGTTAKPRSTRRDANKASSKARKASSPNVLPSSPQVLALSHDGNKSYKRLIDAIGDVRSQHLTLLGVCEQLKDRMSRIEGRIPLPPVVVSSDDESAPETDHSD